MVTSVDRSPPAPRTPMSELPPPPTVPERQDAGRHGKPPSRGKRRPISVHAFHLCISILPAALMACLGLVAVMALIVAGFSSPKAQLTLVVTAPGAVALLCAPIFAAGQATTRRRLPACSDRRPCRAPRA